MQARLLARVALQRLPRDAHLHPQHRPALLHVGFECAAVPQGAGSRVGHSRTLLRGWQGMQARLPRAAHHAAPWRRRSPPLNSRRCPLPLLHFTPGAPPALVLVLAPPQSACLTGWAPRHVGCSCDTQESASDAATRRRRGGAPRLAAAWLARGGTPHRGPPTTACWRRPPFGEAEGCPVADVGLAGRPAHVERPPAAGAGAPLTPAALRLR